MIGKPWVSSITLICLGTWGVAVPSVADEAASARVITTMGVYVVPDVELIREIRIGITMREIPDLRDVHHEQDDVRHIDLPCTPDEASSSDDESSLKHNSRINE